jgi:hypothetical protein
MNCFTKETKMNVAKRTALFLLGLLFLACGSGPAPVPAPVLAPVPASPPEELDAAIRETSDYLNKQLPKGNKLVILNIQSDYPALSEYIIDELIANTVNDRIFSVVDRQQLDTIRAELDFQTSGEVDDETAQALGRLAGAQSIVSGAVSRIGDLYRLRVRALSVQTAQIEGQFNRNIPEGSTVAALVRSQATGYGGGSVAARTPQGTAPASASEPAATVAPVPAPAVPTTPAQITASATYNIGGIGPAGGIIFYDKKNNIGGWQYLEMAPVETDREPPRVLAARKEFGIASDRQMGSGKRNTQALMNVFQNIGGGLNTAYWLCDQLEINGYDDWYLPSIDELTMMYTNLYTKNIGSFRAEKYWSSTHNSDGLVITINFSNGDEGWLYMGERSRFRAVRQF